MSEPLNDGKCEICGDAVADQELLRFFFGYNEDKPRGKRIIKNVLCADCAEELHRVATA